MKLKKRADRCQRYREIQTVLREKTAGDVRYGKIDGIDRKSSEIPGLGGAQTHTESKTGSVISQIRICGGNEDAKGEAYDYREQMQMRVFQKRTRVYR